MAFCPVDLQRGAAVEIITGRADEVLEELFSSSAADVELTRGHGPSAR